MEQVDKQRLVQYYKNAVSTFGIGNPKSVHWNSTETQNIRFKFLSEIADLTQKEILDLGCGQGDFARFLLDQDIKFKNFLGIDILKDYIDFARKSFIGNPNIQFSKSNFIENDFAESDYIFCSGAMNFNIKNAEVEYKSLIERMFRKARLGVAFNMLKKDVHVQDDKFFTFIPTETLEYCKSFCKNFKLIEGYLDYDFTIYLYK